VIYSLSDKFILPSFCGWNKARTGRPLSSLSFADHSRKVAPVLIADHSFYAAIDCRLFPNALAGVHYPMSYLILLRIHRAVIEH
jgi:hypothetical protein